MHKTEPGKDCTTLALALMVPRALEAAESWRAIMAATPK
jgi:hypothetical protein